MKAVSFSIAALASTSLLAMPASAAVMPIGRTADVASTALPTAGHSGWGRYRRHDRVDAGDIIAGVLVLGGIAAVASAASRANRRDRSYPYPQRYPDQRPQYRTNARGIDGAVDMCVREIERNARVADVDSVERTANGWRVTGSMASGGFFDCSIGADGRIDRLDTDAAPNALGGAFFGGEDRQYDDDAYYSARARMDAAPAEQGALPAYPGGPVPGEVDGDLPDYPGDRYPGA